MAAIFGDLEETMKMILGTKVAINQKDDKKGKIDFSNTLKELLYEINDELLWTVLVV